MAQSTDGGPKSIHAAITPSDTVYLTKGATKNGPLLYHALYITGAGNIAIQDKNDVVITYAVPANFILPFRPQRVMATNTTATGIVGWGE